MVITISWLQKYSKDVRLPVQLQRAMAAEAEAAREARAKVIAAEGEQKASRALKEAAEVISQSPAALQLRYLQTLNTISAEKNSTIIFPLPIDFIGQFLNNRHWLAVTDGDEKVNADDKLMKFFEDAVKKDAEKSFMKRNSIDIEEEIFLTLIRRWRLSNIYHSEMIINENSNSLSSTKLIITAICDQVKWIKRIIKMWKA